MDDDALSEADLDPGTDPGSALAFDAGAFRAAVQVGIEQADRGEVVPHERVREWLLARARGEFDAVPPMAEKVDRKPT